jgi:hypothetical protein
MPPKEEIVRPFEAGREAAEIFHQLAEAGAEPEREILQARRFELRAKDERRVEIAGVRAVPRPTTPAAAARLRACEDDERHGFVGGETALGFAVGAVDRVEAHEVRRTHATEVSADEGFVQPVG